MRLTTLLRVVSTIMMIASPWVLYWSLTRGDVTLAGLVLLIFIAMRAVPAWVAAPAAQKRATLVLPAIGAAFAVAGTLLHSGTMFLLLPSATNFAFAGVFFHSLRGTPLIEHFARLSKPNLPADEVIYCRSLTKIWGVFMVIVGGIGLVLAVAAPLKAWLLYAGVISYLLVGLLFAVEYVVRKWRFRDYGRNPLDWALRRVFPPHS